MLFKKIKIILASSLGVLGIASSCLVISSCGADIDIDNDPTLSKNDDEICQYAFDRTFSIAAKVAIAGNKIRWVRGTGWIYKHNTDMAMNGQDYCYSLMTNWHVAYDCEALQGISSVSYGIGYLKSVDDNGIKHSFGYNEYIWTDNPSISDFSFTTPAWKAQRDVQSTPLSGVDAAMYEINLGGLVSRDQYLKNRLNTVNSEEEGGFLLKFRSSPYATGPDTPFYLVGYPSVERTEGLTTRLAKRKDFMEKEGIHVNYPETPNHSIHEGTVESVADCYRFQDELFHLMGGSSGSMILNSDKEVVGIYWGTLTYKKTGKVYGMADLLQTTGTFPYDCISCADAGTKIPFIHN